MFRIFDNPWGLLIVSVVVLLIVLSIRQLLPDKKRWWHLLIPFMIAALAFGLDFLVKTDAEKIKNIINIVVKAVEQEDCETIDKIIDDSYCDSSHTTKQDIMRYCGQVLVRPLVKTNKKTILSLEIYPAKNKAISILTVQTIFDEKSYVAEYKQFLLTKVQLDFTKQLNGNWLINRVELLELDNRPASWKTLKDLSSWQF